MTRKDYVKIADALAFADTDTVEAVIAALQTDNPRFDPIKFWSRIADTFEKGRI